MKRRGEQPDGNARFEPPVQAMMRPCGCMGASQIWGVSTRLRQAGAWGNSQHRIQTAQGGMAGPVKMPHHFGNYLF
jgi:hypothetical protein